MSALDVSEKIKKQLCNIVDEEINNETKECLRTYKAVVTTVPNTQTKKCGVKLVGDETELFLPYSSVVASSQLGDVVWVAVLYNNFRNGIVWATADFSFGGGGGSDDTYTKTEIDNFLNLKLNKTEISQNVVGGAVVRRKSNGNIEGNTPTTTSEYTPKSYVDGAITPIQNVIPIDASSTNKLTTEETVNDKINSVTAYWITKNAVGDSFNTVYELLNTNPYYSGGVVRVPTRNDYAYVLNDENHDGATTRYSYQNGWQFQVLVNETPLTQTQLNALNSGITSTKVSTYDGYATGKQNTLTQTQLNAVNSGITADKVNFYEGYIITKQDTITSTNKLSSDLVDDTNNTNKFVTATEKSYWSAKQNALSPTQLSATNSGITSAKVSTYDGYASGKQDSLSQSQLEATNSGITAEKVAKIDTNSQDIQTINETLTGIEDDLSGALGNIDNLYSSKLDTSSLGTATLTITQNGVTKGTFNANASSDVSIDLDGGSSGSSNSIFYSSYNLSTTVGGTVTVNLSTLTPSTGVAVGSLVVGANGYLGVFNTVGSSAGIVQTKTSLNGLDGNNIIYCSSTLPSSGSISPSIGNFTPQIDFKNGNLVVSSNGYLGRVTAVSSTYLTVLTLASIKGQDGQQGEPGEDGADGVGFNMLTSSSNLYNLAYGCYMNPTTNGITITVGTSTFTLYPYEVMFVYRGSNTTYKYFWVFQSNSSTSLYMRSGYASSTSSGSIKTLPSAFTFNGSSTSTTLSFYAPTTAGTNGYLLKSNGSGAPTWVTNGLAYTPSKTELAKNTSTTSLTSTTVATTKSGYALVDITFGVMLYATSGKYADVYVQNSSSTVIWGSNTTPTTSNYMMSVSGNSRSNVISFTVTVPADGTTVTIGAKADSSAELHLYLWNKQHHN